MEKLIELLNEFWEYDLVEHKWEICKWTTDDEWEINIYTDYTNNIISKKFWFIKWLVENEKINFEWMNWHANIIKHLRDVKKYGWEQIKEWVVLMLLSIQDNPIEFLVSILK